MREEGQVVEKEEEEMQETTKVIVEEDKQFRENKEDKIGFHNPATCHNLVQARDITGTQVIKDHQVERNEWNDSFPVNLKNIFSLI